MSKHLWTLVVGSVIFAVIFLIYTRLLPHVGTEGAVMVFAIAMRNALRVVFLYAVFVILVFGHHILSNKQD